MMTLFEGLYNLLILVVFVTIALWLVYVVAVYGNAQLEPPKITAWWKRRTNRVTPTPLRHHPRGFSSDNDGYSHSP